MRCEDLTRELATPTGALSSAEMSEHLAACPACSEWSRSADRLDRIWAATRPVEPSMEALDALWARASVELDGIEAKAPSTLKFVRPARSRRRWAVVALVAQAAAILVAALVLLDRDRTRPQGVIAQKTPSKPDAVEPDLLAFEVGSDEVSVVRIDKANGIRVEKDDLSYLYNSHSLPVGTPHDEVNAMEAAGSSWALVSK